MAGYQGYNSTTQFERSLQTTMAERVREVEDCSMRNYRIPALVDERGNVLMNKTGEGCDWPVEYKRGTIQTNTGETARQYNRKNRWKKAYHEYRGYQTGDTIYRREFLSNRGEAAIVKVFDDMITNLTTDMEQGLAPQYTIDGNADGNEEAWHGLETMFQLTSTATTIDVSTGAERTANNADIVFWPDATYAGIATELGTYGGEMDPTGNSEVWPLAISSSQYDFWTPLMINVTSTAFGGTNATWADQCEEAVAYGLLHAQRNSSKDNQIDLVLLNREWFRQFKEKIRPKERIAIESTTGLRALGFKNVFMFDDAEISWEISVAANVGYGLSFANVELWSMEATLIHPTGPFYVEEEQAWKADVSTLSNLKFKSPRNFIKWLRHADV